MSNDDPEGWDKFDKTMASLGAVFDRNLNRLVAPRKKPLFTGKSIVDMFFDEITTLPKSKKK